MQNNKKLIISVANNRKSTKWIPQELLWSDLVNKLKTPLRTQENYEQFIKLKKSQQDELKDVGGFVGGVLKDNRRKAENVINRCVITLDADSIEPGETNKILNLTSGLGCSYAVYSTRKHSSYKPRLRILIPLDRTITAEEYEPIARKIASFIGLDIMDQSTFEASRLMYWPSCSKDSEYIFKYEDKPFASADGILKMYQNWKNTEEWPKLEREPEIIKREITKQKDPLTKENIIGAFCKVYDIPAVIEKYLSDIYEAGNQADKYTYKQGSVANGATVYGGGKWLYSFHATDPASRTLCNAFDLVRIHKFGELDNEALEGTPANRLPSYIEMCKFALEDENVTKIYRRLIYGDPKDNFNTSKSTEKEIHWVDQMQLSENGFAKTVDNIMIILENDPNLKDKLVFDRFTGRFLVTGRLPWDYEYTNAKRDWDDNDEACLRNYLGRAPYKIEARQKIEDALSELIKKRSIHVVQDYFNSLKWDGMPRLDTILIDYLGAENTIYTRAVIRKELVAAVARVMTEKPIKFDNMVILTGKQGIGKSTLLDRLGRGWFSDNVKDFNNKDTLLQMQRCLIIEIGELEAFNKTDINALKQFMSQKTDTFRAPYAKRTVEHPRHCVFFGTTNESEFLKDKTGNRRYWPVECMVQKPTKNIFKELTDTEVDQIWAEAVVKFRIGEKLYLEGEEESIAKMQQDTHLEVHPWEGPIREFIRQKVTKDWLQVKILTRKSFGATESENLVERDRICAAEIWCECLGNDLKTMKSSDAKLINGILGNLKFEDIKLKKTTMRFGIDYGNQRGFKIINVNDVNTKNTEC